MATGHTRDVTSIFDRAIYQFATHWLLVINLFWGLFVGLPFLAPVLMNAGLTLPAKVIYTVYRPTCHQLPERSFFLGGQQHAYTAEELGEAGVDIHPFSRDIGNETVGWKTAFCQRDVAIYGSIFLAGIAYGFLRRWRQGWRMKFRYYLLFLVPMAIDGGLQLIGVHESTWVLRTITGVIFGVGSVLFAYPYLDEGFGDVRRSIEKKHHLEDA
jgi:uncharacterized membrane protein